MPSWLVQRTISFCLSSAIFFLALECQPAFGQQPWLEAATQANDSTITIVGGDIHSSSARMTQDLALLLNNGGERRVLPVLGLDSVLSVSDVLHLSGVDIGLVHEDSLNAIGQNKVFPKVADRLQYIAKLCQDNVYLIGGKSITNIRDLIGKKVNFGPGSGSPYSTPALLFQALDIAVKQVNLHQERAVDLIISEKIAATVIVGGDLADLTARFGNNNDWRLIPIPLPSGSGVYVPVTLTSEDYPTIVPAHSSLQTVSVALVMIVNSWSASHKRYQKVAKFVEAFFGRLKDLTKPGYLSKWKEVNLAATLPNWTQFTPAKNWLQSNPNSDPSALKEIETFFDSFLSESSAGESRTLDESERKRLYSIFLTWPKNPGEAQITIRMTANNGVGKKIGTISARNTEILVAGRKEPALLLKPAMSGLRPGPYAIHIHEKPNCGPGRKDERSVPGLAAGSHLWLSGTGALSGKTYGVHLGDLPDLQVDADGVARQEVISPRLTLADIVNRSITMHASQDDASPRMACGVIR